MRQQASDAWAGGAATRSGAGSGTPQLVLVQVLRGLAALLVLLGHTQGEVLRAAAAAGEPLARLPLPPGGFGVDLFFCISGFIMVVSSRELFAAPEGRRVFLLRRAIRLVPLYWLATLAFVPLLLLGTRGYAGELGPALAASLAFIPYPTYGDDGGLVFPLYTLGWTLNYEVFFYLVFALFMFLPAQRAVGAACAALLLVVCTGFAFAPEWTALRFWSQPIVLEFALGMLAALAWLRGWRIGGAAAALMALAAIALVLIDPLGLGSKASGPSTPNDLGRLAAWGAPAVLLLCAATLFERNRDVLPAWLAPAVRLGDCSYSLYLLHPFVLLILTRAWLVLHLERYLGWAALGAALVAGSVGLALVSYRHFEVPCTRWLRGMTAGGNPMTRTPVTNTP